MDSPQAWRTDLRMGWRSLGRNPKRTALAFLAIAAAQAVLIWVTGFMNGYSAMIFDTLTGPMAGHLQIHAPKYLEDGAIERVIPDASKVEALVRGLPRVRSVSPRIYATTLVALKEEGHVASILGLDVAAETGTGGVLEGIDPSQKPVGKEILVGRGLADEMGLKPGNTLALMGQAVDGSMASGLYRVKALVVTPIDAINRMGIVMDLPAARDLLAMGDQAHELVVHADGRDAVPGLMKALQAAPGLGGLDIQSWDQIAPFLKTLLEVVGKSNYLILALVFLTTIAGVANTMLMATFERVHEFGMLLALGCRPGRLVRMMALESLTLGLAGVAAGTLIGLALAWPSVRNGISLDTMGGSQHALGFALGGMSLIHKIYPILRLRDVLNGVGAVAVTSLLAVYWPARKIGRLEPVEAMKS